MLFFLQKVLLDISDVTYQSTFDIVPKSFVWRYITHLLLQSTSAFRYSHLKVQVSVQVFAVVSTLCSRMVNLSLKLRFKCISIQRIRRALLHSAERCHMKSGASFCWRSNLDWKGIPRFCGNNFLRPGGYSFAFIGLSVSRITQKLECWWHVWRGVMCE